MKNLKMVALLAIAGFLQYLPLASADELKSVPTVASMTREINDSSINPKTIVDDRARMEQAIAEKNEDIRPTPPVVIGPPEIATVQDESNQRYLGPPERIRPPFGHIHFPKVDTTYANRQDGTVVHIVSDPNHLSVSWEPNWNATDNNGDVKNDHTPHLGISTSYDLDLKTGVITVSNCVEMCTAKTLTLKNDPKEYLAALELMKEKVDGAPRLYLGPRLDVTRPPIVTDLQRLSKALAAIIQLVEKRLDGNPVRCRRTDACGANPADPSNLTHEGPPAS